MKIAVYSALFGAYDNWRDAEYVNGEYDYFLFTDQPIQSKTHKVIHLENDHGLKHREVKILPQKYLGDYEVLLWHDANIQQIADIKPLIEGVMKEADIVFLLHPMARCVKHELELCAAWDKDDLDLMCKQVQEYFVEGMPLGMGGVETGVSVRRMNAQHHRFAELWWQEVSTKSKRDQLSVMYAAWKAGVKVVPMESRILHGAGQHGVGDGKFFRLNNHTNVHIPKHFRKN